MSILYIDFETFSVCDLKVRGLDNYAHDPSTGIHCLAYAFGEEPVELWYPGINPMPMSFFRVLEHIGADGTVMAHNVAFELAIWNQVCAPKYLWPTLMPEQCRCTMCMAYAMGLPGSLENAAAALGLPQRKDNLGKRIMLKACRPKEDGTFWKFEDDPAMFRELFAYCQQDVEVERALHHRLLELSPREQAVWNLDYRINQRGLLVDLPAIDQAFALVVAEKARLDRDILRVTGGVVGSCTEVQLLVKWIKAQGVKIKGVAKDAVLDALDGELPPQVREALQLRQEAAKSSTAKLVAMRDRAGADGRLRGTKQYHGAATGRWAARGVQTDNFPRPRAHVEPQDVEKILAHLNQPKWIDAFYGPVLAALADSLRGFLIASPGSEFIDVDLTNVEGRVIAWLAGDEDKLNAFRAFDAGTGPDLYKRAYARGFNLPVEAVTKDQRQIGKVMELALGYAGGVGAFQSMAKNYNVVVADELADDLKAAWRMAHPKIVAYWYACENAFRRALQGPGSIHQAGAPGRTVSYRKKGSFLWAKLPSGRVLCYPYAETAQGYDMVLEVKGAEPKRRKAHPSQVAALKEASWVVAQERDDCLWYLTVNGTTNKWEWNDTYGGSLAENNTQAAARDLLAEALLRFDAAGHKVVMHVHDSITFETEAATDLLVREAERLMCVLPNWAAGLPLAAEGWHGRRWRK